MKVRFITIQEKSKQDERDELIQNISYSGIPGFRLNELIFFGWKTYNNLHRKA